MTEKPTLTKYSDGSKEWYLNGKRHRKDGPAIEYADGTKEWYLNGELHRKDGPAIEYANGTKDWYLNGKEITGSELDILLMRAWIEHGKNYFMDEV